MVYDFAAVADPKALTAALRRGGAIGNACVREVSQASTRTIIMSRVVRLCLSYDRDAPGAPRSIILKQPHPDRIGPTWLNGAREVAFYRHVAPHLADGLVPRCFDAQWDAASGYWHLLLEDLTDSHFVSAGFPLPPSAELCERIVAARARFQAAWWDDPRLGVSIGTLRDAAALARDLQDLEAQYASFIDRCGEHVPQERRVIFRRYLDAAPRLLAPEARRPVTIVQGDAHVWNCFLPRDGSDDVRLFDWDGWRVDKGVFDLAHMMTVHWYPDRRRRLESRLLDCYRAALLRHGVQDYDRNTLATDYRVATLRQIIWVMWQAVHDIPPVIWWNNLERVMLAVEDLDCLAVLG